MIEVIIIAALEIIGVCLLFFIMLSHREPELLCEDDVPEEPIQVAFQKETVLVKVSDFTQESIEFPFSLARAKKNPYCQCHILDIYSVALKKGAFFTDFSHDGCHAQHFAEDHQTNLS